MSKAVETFLSSISADAERQPARADDSECAGAGRGSLHVSGDERRRDEAVLLHAYRRPRPDARARRQGRHRVCVNEGEIRAKRDTNLYKQFALFFGILLPVNAKAITSHSI